MDQTRELACAAVACRQGDIYPLYSDFDGFDWGGVKGELGRYSDQVRDDLTRSIRNGVKRACDMARDDRRMRSPSWRSSALWPSCRFPSTAAEEQIHGRPRSSTLCRLCELDRPKPSSTPCIRGCTRRKGRRAFCRGPRRASQKDPPRGRADSSTGRSRLPAGIAPLDGTGQSDTRVRRLPAGIAPLLEGRQRESDAEFPRCSPLA